ncbi:MAG: hypothetical protein ACE366_05090 [Bradymonadia bacterium]
MPMHITRRSSLRTWALTLGMTAGVATVALAAPEIETDTRASIRALVSESISARKAGELESALVAGQDAVDLAETFYADEGSLEAHRQRARALNALGHAASRMGHLEDARTHYTEARDLLSEEPGPRARHELADTCDHLADLALKARKNDLALEHAEAAEKIRLQLVDEEGPTRMYQHGLARSLHRLGRAAGRLGDREAAVTAFAEAVRLKTELVTKWPGQRRLTASLVNTIRHRTYMYLRFGESDEARGKLQDDLAQLRALESTHPEQAELSQHREGLKQLLRRTTLKR